MSPGLDKGSLPGIVDRCRQVDFDRDLAIAICFTKDVKQSWRHTAGNAEPTAATATAHLAGRALACDGHRPEHIQVVVTRQGKLATL